MKVLEALKKIKHLDRKIDANKERISKWCSFIKCEGSKEEPTYGPDDVRKFIQSVTDLIAEKARLRHALHKTNMNAFLDFNGRQYTVDQLLVMQKLEIPETIQTLELLKRKEKSRRDYNYGVVVLGQEEKGKDCWVELQYDPKGRDKELDKLKDMKEKLDELLDMSTASIDLIE